MRLFAKLFLIALLALPGLSLANSPEAKPPTAADVPADALARIRALLNRYPALRVKVGPSPGNGHQRANLRMIQRLRELGYEGRVQVVYTNSNAAKFQFLVPGFDPEQLDMQRLNTPSLGKIEFVSEEKAAPYISSEKMGLGISGALDQPNRPGQVAALNVDASVQLQPRRWVNKNSPRDIRFGDEPPISLQHLWNLGAGIKEETVTDWPSFLEKELAQSPAPIREKAAGIRTLMAADADLMPAYSIDYTGYPDQIMTEVMKGLRKATSEHPDKFQKPIVMPILTEFKNDLERKWLKEAMERQGHRMVSVKAEDLAAQISAARPGEILLVEVGQVPPPVFEGIFKSEKVTLPALLEGKNLTNSMVDAGKPFFNILGSIDDIRPELMAMPDEIRKPVIDAHEAFTKQRFQSRMFKSVNEAAVANYFVAAKADDGPVRGFFRSLKRNPAALENDLVAMSLLELERQLEKRNGAGVPLKPAVSQAAAACAQQFSRFRGPGRAYTP